MWSWTRWKRPTGVPNWDAGAAVGDGHIEDGFAAADLVGAEDGEGFLEGRIEGLPAVSGGLPEQVGAWGTGTLSKVTSVALADESGEGANGDAGEGGVDEEEGDAVGFLGRGGLAGADGAKEVGSHGCVLDEEFCAVEDV